MAVIEVFSSGVDYKYKSRTFSLATLTVCAFIALATITPLLIISNSGGFWLRTRTYLEAPDVAFEYKYLLLGEEGEDMEPHVCTSFAAYKENRITDECGLVKVREVDVNSDGRNDLLNFEARFYADRPVESVRLVLFFDYRLKERADVSLKTVASLGESLNQRVQELRLTGDLELHQRGLLHSQGLYEIYNRSFDLGEYTLPELLAEIESRKFSTKVRNVRATVRTGFSREDPFVIGVELHYADSLIHYQPTVWEELQHAWIQYLSLLLVFLYLARQILRFLFVKRHLNAFLVLPWKRKND